MRTITIFIFLFGTVTCFAQPGRQVTSRNLAWAGLYGQYNFSPRWSVALDVQGRYEYTDGDWYTWLVRPGVTWKTKKGIQLTAGIAFFKLYPNPNSKPPRPEWRPWQETGKTFVSGHHAIFPRVRFEQRFIREYAAVDFEDGYSFSTFRERFRCDYTFTFKPDNLKSLLFTTGDEYMINTNANGKTYFDQNRAWAGFGYRFNKHFTLQLTYLNLFLRKTSQQYEQHHIVRFVIQLRFDKRVKTE